MLAFRFRHFLNYWSNSLWSASLPSSLLRLRDLLQHEILANRLLKSDVSGDHLKLNYPLQSTGSTAELLSANAMQDSSISDMIPGNDRNSSSDYVEALSLLKNNPPEQRLDIPMPYSRYLQLEDSWSKFKSENDISEEMRSPSLSYNSLMQIATVVTTQSALHDNTGAVFRDIIASSVNEYLSLHEPGKIPNIKNFASTTMTRPGPSGWSSKEPDHSFVYSRRGFVPQLQVAIECGVSENYNALCRDKDLWIQQMGAEVVILICLNEIPHYQSPRVAYNIEDKVGDIRKMSQHATEAMENNMKQDNYGPVKYRGHNWLGKLETLFVEVWRANGQIPDRKWLIRHGHTSPLSRSIGLRVRDFFPETEWAVCKIPDSDVPFDGGRLQLDVEEAIKSTAIERFCRFLWSRQA
ncbi:hypothetical protein V1525DRAFT_350979 [Lipomyces kononenkoae]|uniref:Uncharacterized protein n=1 Tax=Lipomyces kononenkoae TaxID=34357 RepID=A0ACC3SQT4_LIPKO